MKKDWKENRNTDFEEYIKESEPSKSERAYAWRTAIGLQAVDGLQVSDYLKETARRNIEGDITIDEARELITTYYQSQTQRASDDDGKEEADKVSANITKLLQEETFAFTFAGLVAIHRRIFEGVFKFAGKIRNYNITKKEWVLRGDTVLYVSATDIEQAVEYDLLTEKNFDYNNLSMDQVAEHIARFVSGLWQIHPFGEGNTRTTSIFTIKYLRSLGFKVNNDLFAENSWYFRNALVRANYKNVQNNINYEPIFLIRFFRNLLMNEHNELKNRYLLINPPKEWSEVVEQITEQPPNNHRTTSNLLEQIDEPIMIMLEVINTEQLTIKQIMEKRGLKHRPHFLEKYLYPAMKQGLVQPLYPNNPHHPRQKYFLMEKGLALYKEINNK